MSKKGGQHFEKALDRYFQRFSSTQRLVIELIAAHKNPIEILILFALGLMHWHRIRRLRERPASKRSPILLLLMAAIKICSTQ
jgi:hypothetical protein